MLRADWVSVDAKREDEINRINEAEQSGLDLVSAAEWHGSTFWHLKQRPTSVTHKKSRWQHRASSERYERDYKHVFYGNDT